MAHKSENSAKLPIVYTRQEEFSHRETYNNRNSIRLIRLPIANGKIANIKAILDGALPEITAPGVVIVIGAAPDLVQTHAVLGEKLFYKHWIAIKQPANSQPDDLSLPNQHFGALIYTHSAQALVHATTRIAYTYCPICDKTTKDYGGKKHTYHSYGTAISDVWRDIEIDPQGDWTLLYERFADLFGIEPYTHLNVIDLSTKDIARVHCSRVAHSVIDSPYGEKISSRLIHGDCLEELPRLPSNSVDFVFTDPPYNLKKKYTGYADDLSITEYFLWCDRWLSELARILKPGGTLALLNIPLWAIRHFVHLQGVLEYQNWIVWDALAFPVRKIMPAHYSIICFSKGTPRALPGLVAPTTEDEVWLRPLAENYCIRASCLTDRRRRGLNDKTVLTDLWSDIHRLKHNSRRVDHPTQLPPALMNRLISTFTYPEETVLDCFNGAGTTTLCAAMLGRNYVGIEQSEKYYQMTVTRHQEIESGIDPFRKVQRTLTAKNSPVARMPKQIYKVPKKTLQLEVKRVTELLGHIPTKEELKHHSKYAMEYYDDYFASWGEVTAAARTTGMVEARNGKDALSVEQLRLLQKKDKYST